MALLKATAIAQPFLDEVRRRVEALGAPIRLVGILGTDARPSLAYSSYAAKGCAKVGIDYEVRHCQPEQVSGERETGTVEVPPRGARRIDMSERPAPESPAAATASAPEPEADEESSED